MANSPLQADSALFNQTADAEFWQLLSTWRRLEDAFENSPYSGDDPEGEAMLDRATAALDTMFERPVATAAAVLAKLEVCGELDPMALMGRPLQAGGTIFAAIRRDLQGLAAAESGNAPARAG